MAVALHVVLLASMVVAFDYSRPHQITPMAIQATLVTEIPDVVRLPVVEEPEPEPEPVIEEPEPEPEPDNSAELQRQAEEEKRRLDALIEQERLEKLRQQEAEEKRRKEREEEQRKIDEEERKEREREAAERKRQEDIQRQREENERLRRELEAEERAQEIATESQRMAAVDAGELAVYMQMIRQKVYRHLNFPASAGNDLECSVRVRQLPGGTVIEVNILDNSCNGDEAVKRSIIAAINSASPLPEPSDSSLFDRNILLVLTKKQD